MICVGAGTQHKKEKKKQPPKIPLEYIVRPKFLECIRLRKKTPKSFPLDTQYTSKKTKEMVKITKSTRSLFLSCGSFSLSFSLSLLFPCCAFFAFVFFLSLLSKCVCACVCVRASVCVSSGLIFVSEFCFHLNHKFSSRARSRTDFVSSLYHLFIQFAASAPATSADRPWP